MTSTRHLFAAALLVGGAATFHTNVAEACGGFVCDGGGPTSSSVAVSQSAERIIFADHGDGTVSAVVQILYEGPADRFGWLLPVPGIPEVGLSSDAAFARLQSRTDPRYDLDLRIEGQCATPKSQNNGTNNGEAFNNGAGNNGVDDGGEPGGVTVLARGNTGPYDYVVIQVDGETNKTQLAIDWMNENNYQVPDAAPDLIGDYLDDGFNLLAIRLQKTQDTGSIRPLHLRYESSHAMIPIKLTAVAANDDMGVMTWVLGPERAIPLNYKSLVLNDALIDWFNPGRTYDDVITAAANEASGQGFVTEFADDSARLATAIWTAGDIQLWDEVTSTTWVLDATDANPEARIEYVGDLLETSLRRFSQGGRTYDGIDQVIDLALPDISAEARERFVDNPYAFPNDAEFPADFSVQTWIDSMEEFVVDPMRETQDLFDESTFTTRMYTTMSANEMTVDPSFDFNPSLPRVSNRHTADYVIECSSDFLRSEAPFRVELPSGLIVRGRNQGIWPISANAMMPSTLVISQDNTEGEAEVVRDNFETVRAQLERSNQDVPGGGGSEVEGGGCSTAGGAGGLGSLAALGLFGLVRRRRRR